MSRVERNLIENKKEEEAEEEEEDEALLVRKGRGKSVGSRSISFPSMRGDVTRVVQINDHWQVISGLSCSSRVFLEWKAWIADKKRN